MALRPGGGRSPSTLDKTPPPPTRTRPPRQPRSGGSPRWPRTASLSVLRLGALIGGIVIILDLLFMLFMERSLNADDVAAFGQMDLFLNYVLFSVLGVLVVRETTIMFAGAIAGLFAAFIDGVVVTAAALMVPPPQPIEALRDHFVDNLVVGTVFAGLSGLVFALVQRWSGGQRSR